MKYIVSPHGKCTKCGEFGSLCVSMLAVHDTHEVRCIKCNQSKKANCFKGTCICNPENIRAYQIIDLDTADSAYDRAMKGI